MPRTFGSTVNHNTFQPIPIMFFLSLILTILTILVILLIWCLLSLSQITFFGIRVEVHFQIELHRISNFLITIFFIIKFESLQSDDECVWQISNHISIFHFYFCFKIPSTTIFAVLQSILFLNFEIFTQCIFQSVHVFHIDHQKSFFLCLGWPLDFVLTSNWILTNFNSVLTSIENFLDQLFHLRRTSFQSLEYFSDKL